MSHSAIPWTVLWACVPLCVLLWGCPEEPQGGECAGPGSVELGAGGARLRPFGEPAELPLVFGSQGGTHVLVGFWVSEMDLNLEATYRVEDPDTLETIGQPTVRALTPQTFSRNGSTTLRNPDLIILSPDSQDTAPFRGKTVNLVLEARSSDAHACDRRAILLTSP